MKKITSLIIILSLVLAVAGCSSSSLEEDAIKKLINDNVDYLNEEDLDGYMSTIDASIPGYAQTEVALGQTFQIYDLKFEAESIEIEEIKDDTAKVLVVQTTKKIGGDQPFQDNRLEIRHTLIKIDGEWKFNKSEMLNMEMLNN